MPTSFANRCISKVLQYVLIASTLLFKMSPGHNPSMVTKPQKRAKLVRTGS